MYISEKVLEQVFEGKNAKSAYLKCCKWVSTNIIAKNNSENITYKIEKINRSGLVYSVKLTVYITVDEELIHEHNCDVCREMSSSFFMQQNKYLCETCKMQPYRRRMKEKLELIKKGLKGKIF